MPSLSDVISARRLDVTKGQIILRAGTQLSARAIGLASAAGLISRG